MPDAPNPRPASIAINEFYEERYAGEYMDTDAYSLWGHGDLRTRQVWETLRLASIEPRRVLDYGCGVGGWIGLLSRAYPNAQITGVDVSSIAVRKAEERFPKCRFETFSGIAAPFADEQFDLIFSYHVLEHVYDIDASIADIARMLRRGGYAVVIFPCGNQGSFLDRAMRLVRDAKLPTRDGRTVLFFETADGHVRRMTSHETVDIFRKHGLQAVSQLFSGHLFGTIDWLCRGTGPAYINRVFAGQPAVGRLAQMRLELTRLMLLALHRLIRKTSLDMSRKRNPIKQTGAFMVKQLAALVDRGLAWLSSLEWRFLKTNTRATAQYLVFKKD